VGNARGKVLSLSSMTCYMSAVKRFLSFLAIKCHLLKNFATEGELPGYIKSVEYVITALCKKRLVVDNERRMSDVSRIIPTSVIGMFRSSKVG